MEIRREARRSPSYASVYINDVQLQMTQWDLRLILGTLETLPTPDSPMAVINEIGDVRMSPQLAKKLVGFMAIQLEDYERRFGPIPGDQPT